MSIREKLGSRENRLDIFFYISGIGTIISSIMDKPFAAIFFFFLATVYHIAGEITGAIEDNTKAVKESK